MKWLIRQKQRAALRAANFARQSCQQVWFSWKRLSGQISIWLRQVWFLPSLPRPERVGAIVWVAQYYHSSNSLRQHEIDLSIARTLALPWISERLLSLDGINLFPYYTHYKVFNTERLAFSHFLELVSRKATEAPDALVILTNSDIELTNDITRLFPWIRMNDLICLSRHEPGQSGFQYPPEWYQDCWIMRAQALSSHLIKACEFYLGIPGCDNYFAAVMREAGFTIWNPCINIKIYHHHASSIRTHESTDRIYGSYYELFACTLEDFILRRHPGGRLRTVEDVAASR
jgi:hypothetical protein